ncbi:uncharacterized protein LOC122365388 isoform X1 [Amphibalanus amphitrite]|uniref:uncharacterized protein LOC122365388 isoform X1 n=1 Tax=Amphibalanus amphitrite TaxID=1232801 RepID=UPI001C9068F8|nr:uncharacterized protein LOC122365388 isoform X1 [Amphibalanus amphitrite]
MATCRTKEEIAWMAMGLDECMCGFRTFSSLDKPIQAHLSRAAKPDSRLFFLMKYRGPTKDFRPGHFPYRETRLPTYGKRFKPDDVVISKKYGVTSDVVNLFNFRHPRALTHNETEARVNSKQTKGFSIYFKAKAYRNHNYKETRRNRTRNHTYNVTRKVDGAKIHFLNTSSFEDHMDISTLNGNLNVNSSRIRAYFGYEKHPSYRWSSVRLLVDYRSSKFSSENGVIEMRRVRSSSNQFRDGIRTNKQEKAGGQLFIIRDAMFSNCFGGVANETGWKDLGAEPDTLKKCTCACKRHYQRKRSSPAAAILQRRRCFCSSSAKNLGVLIAIIPQPAECPKETTREAFTDFNKDFSRQNMCKEDKKKQLPSANQRIRIDTGLVLFAAVWHKKFGNTSTLQEAHLERDLFPRTYRLRFNVTEKHVYLEKITVRIGEQAAFSGYMLQSEKKG